MSTQIERPRSLALKIASTLSHVHRPNCVLHTLDVSVDSVDRLLHRIGNLHVSSAAVQSCKLTDSALNSCPQNYATHTTAYYRRLLDLYIACCVHTFIANQRLAVFRHWPETYN